MDNEWFTILLAKGDVLDKYLCLLADITPTERVKSCLSNCDDLSVRAHESKPLQSVVCGFMSEPWVDTHRVDRTGDYILKWGDINDCVVNALLVMAVDIGFRE